MTHPVDDRPRPAPPALEPAVAPRALVTPWDRARGWLGALRAPRGGETDEQLVARGLRHVRAGTTIAALAMTCNVVVILAARTFPLAVIGSLVTWAAVILGLRHGSRAARWIAMLSSVSGILAAGNLLWISARDFGRGPFAGMDGMLALGMLAVSGGFALATLTRPAAAWFAARRDERRARRERIATAQARWRQARGDGDGDA